MEAKLCLKLENEILAPGAEYGSVLAAFVGYDGDEIESAVTQTGYQKI